MQTNTQTPHQLEVLWAFARLHDWGFDARIVEGGVRVGCDCKLPTGQWIREYAVFSNMSDLRAWAGY